MSALDFVKLVLKEQQELGEHGDAFLISLALDIIARGGKTK